eukprot:TRINITY_DN404_c0_g1_i1.p1 TRINITY_DN404_c0_g1~~TRINITY_DN404_c0_g1_i1.p1  ORF type:complete len:469 (-),score=120.46 TRINITY_DN404_c0_g1_i1:877-2283(-)
MEVRSVVVKSVEDPAYLQSSTSSGSRAGSRKGSNVLKHTGAAAAFLKNAGDAKVQATESIFAVVGGVLFIMFATVGILLAAKLFYDTGEFKTIISHGTDRCTKIEQGIGLEDIVVFASKLFGVRLAFMSGGDRFAWMQQVHQVGVFNRSRIAGVQKQGGIFMYDLNHVGSGGDAAAPGSLVELALEDFNAPDFHPQGIAIHFDQSQNELFLFAVNRRRDFDAVEIFKVDIQRSVLKHVQSHSHPLFRILGDLVPTSPSSYYVTNRQFFSPGSFMYVIEVASKRPWSYVAFCSQGSSEAGNVDCTKVTNTTTLANGIALSSNGSTLYVSSSIGNEIQVYDRNVTSNALVLRKAVHTDSACGYLEVDHDSGDVYAACHPKLLSFWKFSMDSSRLSPSQVLRVFTNSSSNEVEDDLLGNKTLKTNLEEVFLSQGQHISGASVATFTKGKLLLGSSYSNGFLLCDLSRSITH